MSFFKRLRKRPRPSSTSDEVCTSWYSTNPKDLPPGFTIGSMSVPYPPPYYSQQSMGKHKKKKEKKARSKAVKSPVGRNVHIQDTSRLQKPCFSPGLEGEVKKLEEDAGVAHYLAPPLANVIHDPTVPTPNLTTSKCNDKVEGDQSQCDTVVTKPQMVGSQPPEGTSQNGNLEPEVLQETVYDNQKQKRLSTRATLLRSCSADAINLLYRGQEGADAQPLKSAEEVEGLRNHRGITIDEDGTVDHARPYLTHQPVPRSYQVRHRRIVSETRDMVAMGYSPDLLKKQTSFHSISKKTLYKPKNVEVLVETIRTGVDVNTLDEETGNAPIHAIVSGRKRKDKVDLLLALLVYSKVDVNLPNRRNMTALHLAIEDGDELCIRALLTFGANINAEGKNLFTPLDLAMNKNTIRGIERTLTRMGAKTGIQLVKESNPLLTSVPRIYSFAENMKPPPIIEQSSQSMADVDSELANQRTVMELYRDLEVKINQKLTLSASYSEADESPEEAYALLVQQRELNRFNKTLQKSGIGVFSGVEGGSRILFLDGGGIKGLVQLEVLMQLEEATGRKVTELFDWIVGTSTGGVIALTLVYGKKSLREIFQLYFLLKDKIFSKSRIGFGFNTEALEEILQEYLDPDIRMTDVTHPKVLISAVNKATTNLELHFFNNCFGDEFMDHPVWKVARYTSATPMFFSECDNYIDGGVICNNPTEYGLTAIQNFFRQQGKRLPIALVVSIGTGVYPAEELGSIDLFLGIGTITRFKQRTQNLISLLGNALVESEMVATNSHSRCREQGIPFYRFSPKLRDVIAGGETDNEKLFNMVIQTRIDTREQGMEEVVRLFHTIAHASHHLAPRIEVAVAESEIRQKHGLISRLQKEETEMNSNLDSQPSLDLLQVPPSAGQTVLSDIEETEEVVSKKSHDLVNVSRETPFLPAIVVEEETQVTGKVSSESQERAAARSNETDGPSEDEVGWFESANTNAEGGVKKSEQEVNGTFSDRSSAERGSRAGDDNETDITRSQNSSVFFELASSSELERAMAQENGDVDHRPYVNYRVSSDGQSSKDVSASEDAVTKEMRAQPLEPEESQRNQTTLIPEEEGIASLTLEEPKESLKDSAAQRAQESKRSLEDQTVRPKPSHESTEDQGMPPPSPDDQEHLNYRFSTFGEPFTLTKHDFSSQEALESTTDDASSVVVTECEPSSSSHGQQEERSSTPHGLVMLSEKVAEEQKQAELCSRQMRQEVLDKTKEQSSGSTINGCGVVEVTIPKGSSHSTFIHLESPRVSGPPKKILRTADDERGIPNGDIHGHFLPTRSAHTTSIETQSTVCLANGHKSDTQIPKLKTANGHGEVPDRYKLDAQLSPETQLDVNCNFPYRFETEI